MDKEIYISWCPGIERNTQALNLIKQTPLIKGIEITKDKNTLNLIKKAGIPVSLHNPQTTPTFNLASDITKILNLNPWVIDAIKESDNPYIAFHLAYSCTETYKMVSYPNIPKPNSLIKSKEELLKRITNNLLLLGNKLEEHRIRKKIILETMDYTANIPINWGIQNKEVQEHKEEINKMISQHGTNAGLLYVTEPELLNELFTITEKNNQSIGFLSDISHMFISGNTKIKNNTFNGTIEDYFDSFLKITKGKTHQIHINVPQGTKNQGYYDSHKPFTQDELSEKILRLTKKVIKQCPEIKIITLEMDSGNDPVEHAKKMIEQAEYFTKQLNL